MILIITDVAWVRDRRDRQVLQLRIEGHLAHILPARQRRELIRRGIVDGIDLLASDWQGDWSTRPFIRGTIPPHLAASPLPGCTDDPQVFALYEEMCRAIRAGTWQPGPRSLPL
jgi:hypothetical protein